MKRVYNFFAGPSTLPLEVLQKMEKDFVDYQGSGLSLIETSHRSAEYDLVHKRAVDLTKQLLGITDTHSVMMIQGGATMQFGMIPMNLLAHTERTAAYVNTGAWAKKAIADAKKVGKIEVIWDGADNNFMSLPAVSDLKIPEDATYLHMTSNETIGGIQFQEWPDTDVPIVADMSSDIMSRPLPMEKFGMIYAGAQKNLAPAGMTLVIMRNDLLEKCVDNLPAYLSYKTHAPKNSLYNTPPVFTIWAFSNVLEWIVENGGLEGMAVRAEKKAGVLYGAMDDSSGFYKCPVDPAVRSKMNVVWRLPTEELEARFVAEAKGLGMLGLKGHRSVGGCRASIYNAMAPEGVAALAQFMRDFQRNNG
jgi:phosphoserine aminotransferase